MDSTCEECGSPFTPKSKRSRYCADKCRYRAKDRARTFPCSICGEPMQRQGSAKALPPGQAAHRSCRAGQVPEHGYQRYWRGCRCTVCKAAVNDRAREYSKRAEVKAARQARRSSPEGKAREAEQRAAWVQANPDKASVLWRAKSDRRRKAHRINYTPTQLMQRMSMFSACWICNEELGDDWHKDHVKPIARGGWDTLSNLRPTHAACNLRKGAQWPFEPSKAS